MISATAAAILIAAIYGLSIGSFLNVVIWRLPRGGSLSTPAWSYCPRCEHRLGAWDLFPLLSFAALGGRCRYCRAPISWRYPGVELLTGLLFALAAERFSGAMRVGNIVDIVFACAFLAVLLCVALIDWEHFIIPDGLNVFAFLLGLAHWGVRRGLSGSGAGAGRSFGGGIAYAALLYAIGLLAYVALVGIGGKRGAFRSAGNYIRENALDWAWIVVYYAGKILPPLRRYAQSPEPAGGFTAQEIESDPDEGGMGGGDAKLALAIGANLLWPLWLESFGFAIVLGCIQSVIVLAAQKRRLGERTAIPFGPAMAGGAALALFFGRPLLHWYVAHYLSFPGSPYAGGS